MENKRTRIWATIVYPESAPEGWTDALAQLHVSYFVSPLHDQDLNPTGEKKKAHYHVMLMFDGVKAYDQVLEMCKSFGAVRPEKVNSIRNYARYLCHLDNPDKYVYDPKEVLSSGADYYETISLPSDRYSIIDDIIAFCESNQIYMYCDLLDYARQNKFDWFRVLCDSGTYVVKEYMKSMKFKKDSAVAEYVDKLKGVDYDTRPSDH